LKEQKRTSYLKRKEEIEKLKEVNKAMKNVAKLE